MVTGASGFIGSHLVDSLLSAGYRVHGVDRRDPQVDPRAAVNLGRAWTHPAFTFSAIDLATDPLAHMVTNVQTVFHLAAVPGVRACWHEAFQRYVTANVLATHRLLDACEQAGVPRLVYASSSSVYGPADRPSRETDPTAPASPYGVSKLAGEHLCRAHASRADTNLSVMALRYFTVYGPRQRSDMAIGRMLCAALIGGQFTLFGDGTQRREFTYITDVVAATMAATHVDLPWAVVNIGGGSSIALIDLLPVAQEVTNCPVPVTAVAAQPGDVPATAADLSRARYLLGYRPQVDVRTGMAAQAAWLRELPPHLLADFAPADPIGTEVAR